MTERARRRRLLPTLLALAAALALMLAATLAMEFASEDEALTQTHGQAALAVVVLGQQRLALGRHLPESALLELPPTAQQPPPATADWRPLALPDLQPRDAALDGRRARTVSLRWYRLSHRTLGPPGTPQALFVARAIGGPLVLWGRAAGAPDEAWRLLHDNRTAWLTQWNRPLLIELPAASGPAWDLALALPAIDGAPLGLSELVTGSRDALQPLLRQRLFWQVHGPQLISLAGLLMGALALSLAWRGQQRAAHLLFAAITVVWALRNLHFFVAPPAGREAYEWFWWVSNVSVNWLVLLLHLFVLRFVPRRLRRLERGLMAYCAAVTLLTLPLWPLRAENLLLQHASTVTVSLGVAAYLLWRAWRGGSTELRVLAVTLAVGTAMAAHDLVLLSGRLPPDHLYLLPYAFLLLLLAFQQVLARRHAAAFDALARLNTQQQRRLDEQQAALEAGHRRELDAERERALLRERQRLMRDMHDGLGASLLSSLALAQRSALSQPALAKVLAECIDDLRLVIDSLEPIDEDLATLLGTLRLRLGPRLQAAGLNWSWSVAPDLPALPWLDPPSALQLLRIAQEVVTNVLKHAGARRLEMSLTHDATAVQVRFDDDGRGFDPSAAARGRGLRNLRQRAAQLGATLTLDSAPGRGTRVGLRLPLQRPGAAAIDAG